MKHKAIDFNWGKESPIAGFPHDDFSIRWTSCLTLKNDTMITFSLSSNDGARLYVNGELLINTWQLQNLTERRKRKYLPSGVYPIRIDYFEAFGIARVHLKASFNGSPYTLLDSNHLTYPKDTKENPC